VYTLSVIGAGIFGCDDDSLAKMSRRVFCVARSLIRRFVSAHNGGDAVERGSLALRMRIAHFGIVMLIHVEQHLYVAG